MKGCYCSITISPVVSGYRVNINTVHITSKRKLTFWCALCYLRVTTNKNSWIKINNYLYCDGLFNSFKYIVNPLTPNDHYSDRTAPLTFKRCILYIYSTNIGTEYFKHVIYSPFFFSKRSLFHNSNVFGSCIIHILYRGCAKIKK